MITGAGAKMCPPEGICTNCMPVNDTDKYTCWPIKTPIMYTLNSYGKLKAPRGREVDAMMSEIYANGPITCGVSCPEVSASLAIPRLQMLSLLAPALWCLHGLAPQQPLHANQAAHARLTACRATMHAVPSPRRCRASPALILLS